MLYYRKKKSEKNRFQKTDILIMLLILWVWFSWFLFELPFETKRNTSMVSTKGSVILATQLDSGETFDLSVSFTEPAVGVLTSPYGKRWGRIHEGIDIGGDQGSEILAAASGVVNISQWVDGYGNYIEIEHDNDFKTVYGHCDELLVSVGESVHKGQSIATMGNTGNSTGPHLHFEVLHHGEPQNPLDYVIY